ncbi:MAG: hypothetical protein ACRD0P_02940 [Stackebrandtia sp.]
MSKVILPVGKPNGAFYGDGATASSKPEVYEVHFGDEVAELSFDEWAVWLSAHDLPDKQEKHEFDRYVLRDHIRSSRSVPVAKPVPHIEKLLERGLLVEADLLGADQKSFCSRYRLIPTGFGMGNTADEIDMTWVGQLGQRMVLLPTRTYQVYAYSYRSGSMWDACVEFADDDLSEAESVPEDYSDGIAEALPTLVGALPLGFLESMA